MRSILLAVLVLAMCSGCPETDTDTNDAGLAGDGGGGLGVDGGGSAGGDGGFGRDAGGNPGSDGGPVGDGGSPGGQAGVVTFDTFAFYRPDLVAGPDGVLHMVFHINSSPSTVQYARCAGDCGVGANWTVTSIGSGEFTGSTRLVVGADGRLHLIYEVGGLRIPQAIYYATCAANCTQAASWSKTELGSLFGGGWTSPSGGSPLVVDAQNRISFTVDRSIYLDGGLTLATCASNCTSLSSWSAGRIRTAGTRTSLAARGTTLHQLVDNGSSSDVKLLSYRTCASNCTQESSWQELSSFLAYDGSRANAIAVTATGGVRVIYNQGVSDAAQPPAVKAQDRLMLYWSCDANCLQTSSWHGITLGAVDDGEVGITMAEQGGAIVLAVTNGGKVFTRFCQQDCLTESNWQDVELDNSAAMHSAYDPYAFSATSCSSGTPTYAGWSMERSAVAIRPDGAAAFAHAVSILRTCPGSSFPGYLPGFGRVVYLP